jgi:O-antigen ligase
LTLGGLTAAALLVGVAKMDSILGLQREGTVADTRQSASMRKSFTYVSWLMFQDRPVTGFGFGQFASAKLPYLSDRSVDLHLESIRGYVHHNTFLSILTETGLIGLMLFLAVFLGWTKQAWRLARDDEAPPWKRRQAILSLGVFCVAFWQMTGHEITFTPLDMSLVLFLAGLATSAAQRQEQTDTVRASLPAGWVVNRSSRNIVPSYDPQIP